MYRMYGSRVTQERLPRSSCRGTEFYFVNDAVGPVNSTKFFSVSSVPRQLLLHCPTYGLPALICGECFYSLPIELTVITLNFLSVSVLRLIHQQS